MRITTSNTIVVLLLVSSVLLINIILGAVLMRKYKSTHSRPYLLSSLVFFVQSFGIIMMIHDALTGKAINRPFEYILETSHIINGFLPEFAVMAYLIEVIRPGAITLKRLIIAALPVFAISVTLFLLREQSCVLRTVGDLSANIGQADVRLRLLLVCFYLIYPIQVICTPRNRYRCLVSRNVTVALQLLFLVLGPIFVAGMLFGYLPAFIANFIFLTIFDAPVIYVEFRVRIPVTEPAATSGKKTDSATLDEKVFDDPKVWMDPDMTAVKLANMLGTNRTYLAEAIKGLGYSGYSDMVNRKRVTYICQRLKDNKSENITNLFFESGFRSRSAASSEFKRIAGCSPSEFVNSGH